MSIATRLDEDAKTALRAGDKLRLSTIRRARAALKNAEIEARGELSDRDALQVLRGMVKRHQESIDQFAKGGRQDLVDKETAEMAVLEEYLPPPMDAAQVEAVVAEVIAEQGVTDMTGLGKVMKPAIERLGGQVDGGTVRQTAQRLLGG
jgi:uncharacterized protein